MEETKVKGKVSRKEAKRKRNMRNTVIMAGLSVALLGGATYAWFTLSETAKVTNLTLTVGEAGGLQIADIDETGNASAYGTVLPLPDAAGVKLLPATCIDSIGNVVAPDYEEGAVEGTVAINELGGSGDYHFATFEEAEKTENAEKVVYYLQKTFYLKTEQGAKTDNFEIVLDPGSGWEADGIKGADDTPTGTYILTKDANTDTSLASAAIRISFQNTTSGVTLTTAEGIYEPNSNLEGSGMGAEDNRSDVNTVASTVEQDKDGDFDVDTANSTDSSDTLFQIAGGKTDNKIVMKVWLEGTDNECVNEAALETLVGELKFRMK